MTFPLTRSTNRTRFFGKPVSPIYSQTGPTLDLVFAGIPTDPLGAATLTDYTLNTDFTYPQYQIAEQYTVWEDYVGLVSKTFSQIITFTRASTGTFFDATGTLQSAAIDAPRFDYDPATLAAQGLLIEEARTNSIRNNTMQGAVAGTPGTVPTNWQNIFVAGITSTVVGTGTSNGITYLDIRISGTPTVSSYYNLVPDILVAGASGQTWAGSFWASLVAGSLTNTNANIEIRESDAAQGFLVNTLTGIAINSTLTRYSQSRTLNNASTAFVSVRFVWQVTNGLPVDFTLRIGLPQLEQGAFATSVIETSTTALTRSADAASVNTLSPWYNQTASTIYAELMRPALIASTGFANAWSLSDNTSNERFLAYNTGSGQTMDFVVADGGVAQAILVAPGSITANTIIKTAFAFAVNDFAWVRDAGTVQTDTSGTLPTVDRLYIGANAIGVGQWTGWIRRLTAYPRRLSNAELQSITS